MKTRIIIISTIIISLFSMTSCNKEKDPVGDLKNQVPELKTIEERSATISSEEEAFTLLADLNGILKSVRNSSLEMDEIYNDEETTDAEKAEMMKVFDEVSVEIDKSLHIIRENIKPYEGVEEVNKMIEKLNKIMITK